MINILTSRAKAPSKDFKNPVPRKKDEDNISWLSRNLPPGDVSHIVLVGGKSQDLVSSSACAGPPST